MVKRDLYLDKIRPFIDKPFIKVITGIRRCGKSTILMMIKEEILDKGIDDSNIVYINFESMLYSDIDNGKKLYSYVKDQVKNSNKYYLFFDEIQEVKDWEKAINSFLIDFDCDIYITGSNSKLLSSELATYLTGRYVEINVNTLSFGEYLDFREQVNHIEDINTREELKRFIRLGGFPAVHTGNYDIESAYKIVSDIYSSALLRDTIQRYKIRNIELLERIVKFVFDNVGNTFSANNIAKYFKSQQRNVDINTIYNYLNALEASFIIQKVSRYDIAGKNILKTNEKFYLADQSLKYATMGYKDRAISGILENIVYLELKSRGYDIFIGKLGDTEVDFIAEKQNKKVYIQVSYVLVDESTIEREFRPLLKIKDHYPKYVVTMDDFFEDNIDGVKHVNLADFLLMKKF